MVPGRSLGVPWGVPGSVWGTPGASRGPFGTLPGEAAKINKKFKRARSPKASILGPGRDPKIDKKWASGRKSASGDGAGSDFCRFFLRLPFGVALRTDFWRVRPLKALLFLQREHNFDKITVFKKTPKK